MKKIIALILCALLLTPCAGVYASSSEPAEPAAFTLEFDGEDITEYLYYDPIVDEDGTVYFALEDLLEMFELYFTMEYDADTNTMSVTDDRMGKDDEEFMTELESFMPNDSLDYEAYFADEYFMDGIREAFSAAEPEAALLFFIGDFLYWLNDDKELSELWDLWDKLFGYAVEADDISEGGDADPDASADTDLPEGVLTYGDSVSIGDIELEFGSGFDFAQYDGGWEEIPETYIRIPVTITNTSDQTVRVSSDLDYVIFGASDSEIEDINYTMDDSLTNVGRLRRNGAVDTYFYIPYEGDMEYVVEFSDYWGDTTTEFVFPVY
ncbi:MAG: hypothetical protein LBS19_12310 [Clostridiales bacterium]|jgi:hypothetical protein|nr:hypothetical protein [Clostridiales bacterium]